MKKSFLNRDKSILTVMLQCETPEVAIGRIRNTHALGAEAFGLQIESLLKENQNEECCKRIFAQMREKPIYVTNYRYSNNAGKSDEELAEGLIRLADCGATLCDVMGDMYSVHPKQMTENKTAIEKQMRLIDTLHSHGAEVLMSAHIFEFTPAEQVLEIAREQKRRGADVIKIVTGAETDEEEIENLRITSLLKRELNAPFLFLSVGKCSVHRRLGMRYGCSMALCVYEHDHLSTANQPMLTEMKTIRDNLNF